MWNHFCGHQNLNENNNSFPRSCSLFKVKILLYTLVGSILLSVLIVPSGRSSFHFKICLVNSLKSITVHQQMFTANQKEFSTRLRKKRDYTMLNRIVGYKSYVKNRYN